MSRAILFIQLREDVVALYASEMTHDVTIAAAQTRAMCGDLVGNVATHVRTAQAAAGHGVSFLVFPELSLTGYDPAQVGALALDLIDERLRPLADIARRTTMTMVVGVPLRRRGGLPYLGAIIVGADGRLRTYAKQHLGEGERAFFTPGDSHGLVRVADTTIGLAICADTAMPGHPAACAAAGASVYAAGVFLNDAWFRTDTPRFPRHAAEHRLLVLMANHAASSGPLQSVGRSAAWGPDGTMLAQADGTDPCLIVASRTAGAWLGASIPL